MELDEPQRREMVERQEEMIREIAAANGQSAQMLRAMNRRAYNAPTDSLADDRSDGIDALAQYVVDGVVVERARLARDRIGIMQDHVAKIGTIYRLGNINC